MVAPTVCVKENQRWPVTFDVNYNVPDTPCFGLHVVIVHDLMVMY